MSEDKIDYNVDFHLNEKCISQILALQILLNLESATVTFNRDSESEIIITK